MLARRFFQVSVATLTLGFVVSSAQAQITFNLVRGSGIAVGSQADIGFQRAAARWSSIFGNTFTMNINIDFTTLGAGVLGSAGSAQQNFSYSAVRSALVSGATSVNDAAAVASLPVGTSIPLLTNYTSDSNVSPSSPTPYVDNDGGANNSNILMTTGNAKALGLRNATNAGSDASITFNSSFTFDFNPDDGITSGQYDFVGVATHEIGHALGFISGVDELDTTPGQIEDNYRLSTMDLFRYSSASRDAGRIVDFTAGLSSTDRYFSLNNGVTKIASFSLGRVRGDGNQASHWKDNQGIGIMDPTGAPGELLSISAADRQLFDVIGYRIVGAELPEPSALALLAGSLPFGIVYQKRRKRPTAQR